MLTGTLLTLLATTAAKGALLTTPSQLTKLQYDYIIVGAGTAGCVLASRLSEDPSVSVIVVEAGLTNENILGSIVPFLGVALSGTSVDWNFTSTPQSGLHNRVIELPRGFVLGGSSSTNLLTFNRGSDEMWDDWAKLTGDQGWAWKSVEQFYLKTSQLVPPADGHDASDQEIPAAHGTGPVLVSVPGFPIPSLDDRVINSSKLLGGRFAFNQDVNAGVTLGFTSMQSSIGDSKRSSSATAYLQPALVRPNLDVLITTRVTKLLSKTDAGIPAITGVEIAQSSDGPSFLITAGKETIVSAGTIGTPQLLQVSGIGPASLLKSKGITPLVPLNDVGQNLVEHPLLPNYFSVNSNDTFDSLLRNETLFGLNLQEYFKTGSGVFVNSPGNTQAFMRLPDDSSIFKMASDPSSGPQTAHTEIVFVNGFASFGPFPVPAKGNFITVLTSVVSPTSRGTVSIQSADIFTQPLIDPNFLDTDFDQLAMVQAMKDVQEFLQACPWVDFIGEPLGDLATATNDLLKLNYAQKFSSTFSHISGTAAMSPVGAAHGVVDPNLLVKRLSGLSVVDASVFPTSTYCHTQSIVYTVAERAAELIKARHK